MSTEGNLEVNQGHMNVISVVRAQPAADRASMEGGALGCESWTVQKGLYDPDQRHTHRFGFDSASSHPDCCREVAVAQHLWCHQSSSRPLLHVFLAAGHIPISADLSSDLVSSTRITSLTSLPPVR